MQRAALSPRRVALRDRLAAPRAPADAALLAPARTDSVLRAGARNPPGRGGGIRQVVSGIQSRARRARRTARTGPAPRRRADDGHTRDRPRSDRRRLEDRTRWRTAARGAGRHRRHGRALRSEVGQRRPRALDPRRPRPHDPSDLSRADPPDGARVAVHGARRPLPARDDHGPLRRAERLGHRRLPVHPPRLQRPLGSRRLPCRGAIGRGRLARSRHGPLEQIRREGLAERARARDAQRRRRAARGTAGSPGRGALHRGRRRSDALPRAAAARGANPPRRDARPRRAPLVGARGLREGRGHRRRREPRGGRSRHDGEPQAPGALSLRRDPRRVRPDRGLQFPVGVGDGTRGGDRGGAKAREP